MDHPSPPILPYAVKYAPIGSNLEKVILCCHIMHVSSLGIQKIRTRDPDLFVDVTAQSQDGVRGQMSKR